MMMVKKKKTKKKKTTTMWQAPGHLHAHFYATRTEMAIPNAVVRSHPHLPHPFQLKDRLSLLGIRISLEASDSVLHVYRRCKSPPPRKHVLNHIIDAVPDLDECLDSLLVQLSIDKGLLDDAYALVCSLNAVSILVWNCLVGAYAEKGKVNEALHVFQKMQERGVSPDKVTFLNAISSCHSPLHLLQGQALHHSIVVMGCDADAMVCTALVTMYSKCGSLEDASNVFHSIEDSNIVSWTAMIGAYACHGWHSEAFQHFDRMKQEAVMPNRVTFLCFLEAFSDERSLKKGRQLHCSSVAMNRDSDVNLSTAFLNMYSRCGSLEDARHIFLTFPHPDVVLWNSLLAAFIHHEEIQKALHTCDAMQQEGWIPNPVTYATIISACVLGPALSTGKRIHARIAGCGLEDDVFVTTSLIYMYGKHGKLEHAACLFDHLKDRNVVTWNALIMAYAEQKHVEDVMQLLETMHQEGVCANEVTYASAVEAHATYKALPSVKKMHCCIRNSRFKPDTVVETALMTMYSRCGSFDDACLVFDEITHKSIVSWNAMVSAYCQHGLPMQAFEIYEQMQEEGANPDQTTYTSVLSACTNQLTLLTFGAQIHSDIIDNGFEPDVVVGTSLLNMYGKCGSLEDAHKTFDQMSQKNVVSWNVMISIYSQHGHAREAIHCVHKMQEDRIVPNKVTFIALISACSHGGMLVEGCTNLDPLLIVHDARVSLELYHCVFDLLGRAGLVEEAKDLLCMMPLQPSLISWVTVLGACRNQADVVHGSCAAKHVFELDPNNTATTLMLETIYDNFASDASSSLVHC